MNTFELEIWGGSASYLRRFPRRKFSSIKAASKYIERISEYLDELGVKAAHPMVLHDAYGKDITDDGA